MMDLLCPPAYRYQGPIIDAHCHFASPDDTDCMLRAGRLYGVQRWVGICHIEEVAELRERLGPLAAFNIWTDHQPADDPARFTASNLRIVAQAVRLGCHGLKFWYKPEFNQRTGLFFDDPSLDPVFQAAIDAGLPVLVHIADPDVWWLDRYRDPEQFEAKRFTFRQLTNTLQRFPGLRVLAAHLGGWPENLPFLDHLLRRYPNLHLDTSGTKWVARELSRQPVAVRDFFIRNADRLLFGSDLVAFQGATPEHHASRYWVHRHLYERDDVIASPIDDPDAQGRVHLAGLNLPDAVLSRLYHDNAAAFFRLNRTGT